jgi:hypothetical protein
MQRGGELWDSGSNYFFILSTSITFVIPVLLLVLPWFALLVQVPSLLIAILIAFFNCLSREY